MIKRVTFTGFRGADGVIGDLAPINLFLGPNNGGKSTCLEAIACSTTPPQKAPSLFQHLIARRGFLGIASTRALFGQSDEFKLRQDREPGGEAGYDVKLERDTGRIYLPAHGYIPLPDTGAPPIFQNSSVTWLDARAVNSSGDLEHSISVAERAGARAAMLSFARHLAPDATDLRLQVDEGRAVLYVEEGQRYWPALVGGDGFKRLMLLAAHLAVASPSRIVLIEEPDAFLHKTAIDKLAALLIESSRRATAPQIFATTHSIELVRSLIRLSEGASDIFAVFKTERKPAEVSVKRYSAELAEMEQPALERALGYY